MAISRDNRATLSENNPSLAEMATNLFWWPVADGRKYEITGGEIRAAAPYKGMNVAPLQNRDFFAGFVRLWKEGEPPSERKIRSWIKKFGLFRATDVMALRRRGEDASGARAGDPLKVTEFRNEVHQAHDVLRLYEAVINRRGDVAREHIERGERIEYEYPAGPHGKYHRAYARIGNERHATAHVIPEKEVPDKVLAHVVSESPAPDDGLALMVAEFAIRQLLSDKLDRNMELRFGQDFAHQRPLAFPSRPVPVFVPRDLRAALWWQFVEEITEYRAWKLCDGCEQPFPVRRKGQECCAGSPNCRKKKERKKRAG